MGCLQVDHPDDMLIGAESPDNLNVGEIRCGDWPSSVPVDATVRVRVGYPRSWTPDEAAAAVRTAVASVARRDGGFPVEPTLRLSGFRAPGYWLSDDHALTRTMARAHQGAHGVEPASISTRSWPGPAPWLVSSWTGMPRPRAAWSLPLPIRRPTGDRRSGHRPVR